MDNERAVPQTQHDHDGITTPDERQATWFYQTLSYENEDQTVHKSWHRVMLHVRISAFKNE